jgi:hypothetical protein
MALDKGVNHLIDKGMGLLNRYIILNNNLFKHIIILKIKK